MYYVCSEIAEERRIFGLAKDAHKIVCFTEDIKIAEDFVNEMNGLNVEEMHILDIVEDRFYSG